MRMGSYLSDDEAASEEWCSLVEHKMTGFVRTEVLFNVLTDIFANKSDALDLWTGCKVTKIAPKTQVQGSKIEVTTHKNCGLDGVREFDRVSDDAPPLFLLIKTHFYIHCFITTTSLLMRL